MLGYPDSYDDLRGVLARQDHVLVFYHLHKTAGTTLEKALLRHYGSRALRCHTAADRPAVLEALKDPKAAGGGRLVYGHFASTLADDVGALGYRPRENLFRFTIIRHPVQRAESFYSFAKGRDPHMPDDMKAFLNRYQGMTAASFFECQDNLDHWLRNGIDFIGVSEIIDVSLALLFQMLDVPLDEVASHNVSKVRPDRMPPDLLSGFMQRFAVDFQMYELARASLEISADKHLQREAVRTHQIASYVRATVTNANLETNRDAKSLLATGITVFPDDADRALAYFRKALKIDPNLADRIYKFLFPRDRERLVTLYAVVREDYAGTDDPVVNRTLAWLNPERVN